MQVTINVRNPKVYFINRKKNKYVVMTGHYVSQTNGESDKFYEIQGTRSLYTKVCRYDYFGRDKGKAEIECKRRNDLDKM